MSILYPTLMIPIPIPTALGWRCCKYKVQKMSQLSPKHFQVHDYLLSYPRSQLIVFVMYTGQLTKEVIIDDTDTYIWGVTTEFVSIAQPLVDQNLSDLVLTMAVGISGEIDVGSITLSCLASCACMTAYTVKLVWWVSMFDVGDGGNA